MYIQVGADSLNRDLKSVRKNKQTKSIKKQGLLEMQNSRV